jgi:hypothetical protein
MTHEPRTSIRASNAPTSLDVAARRGCPLFYSTVSPLWLPFALAVVIGSLMRARYICTHARACIKRSRLYNQRSASENEMASARRACGRIGNCTRARARISVSTARERAAGSKFRARRRRTGSVLFRIRSWHRRARNDPRSVITGPLRFHKCDPAAAFTRYLAVVGVHQNPFKRIAYSFRDSPTLPNAYDVISSRYFAG